VVKIPFPDDWSPAPTVFKGGIQRMLDIWENLRGKNAGGYGPGAILQAIGKGKDRWEIATSNVTSCSPFTATVLGMLFDPSGASSAATFEPVYDNGSQPLPQSFYSMHQGNYWGHKGYYTEFKNRNWEWANDPAGSMEFFNLGYEVEARDLRRGDLVGITWSNDGGHAVFVWDVHLDDAGDVDAFTYVSANGLKKMDGTYAGFGVSLGGCTGKAYFTGRERGSLQAISGLFQDRPSQVVDAEWLMVPGKAKAGVTRATNFIAPGPPKNALDYTDAPKPPVKKAGWVPPKWPFHVKSLRAARLWGIHPPDRKPSNDRQATAWDEAKHLGYEYPKDSYATVKSGAPRPPLPPPHIESVTPVVHKEPVETVKTTPPKPAPQHPERPTVAQHFVEDALDRLWRAKWIEHHPGDPKQVNDGDTKAAVREFQAKFDAPPIDGIAGPITRKALQRALGDLAEGKPPPHAPSAKKTPRLDRVAWLRNRVEPGEAAFLAVHGVDLDLITSLDITLEDRVSKQTAQLAWPCVLVNDIGVTPVVFPAKFSRGAEILASFAGAGVHYKHDVPIYIGAIKAPTDGDWPWDEALWTPKMRDIIADLRATPTPTGPFERWEITQYGVKEKMQPGEVPVKSASGEVFGAVTRESLMKADIEGTMRLSGKILNITHKGNVYEPREVIVDGKKVIKNKPNPAKFDPSQSLWTDVTAKAPWGAGAKMPLIPFRTLALNPTLHPALFYQKVYIKQLDGMTLPDGQTHNGVCIAGDVGLMKVQHFDLCVGREDHHIQVPSVGGAGGTMCEVQILGECAASRPGKKS
jgi:hypothetical protein